MSENKVSIFNRTADALGVSGIVRDRAWAMLGRININPDDPEAIRILVTEHEREIVENLNASLEKTAEKVTDNFGKSQAAAESAAMARLKDSSASLALDVADKISGGVMGALADHAKAAQARATTSQWAVGGVLILIGFWFGKASIDLSSPAFPSLSRFGDVTAWLAGFNPWVLVSAPAAIFMTLRLIAAWTSTSPLVRFLLALPSITDLQRFRRH